MSDRLNPILVREARIMVRSRWIVLMIVLYQFILVAVTGVALFVILGQSKPETVATQLFSFISLVTWNVTVIAVTVYTGWRMATDRINEDLLFYSTISPSQNIRGRLACGFILSVLFYSMTAFFLWKTLLRRWVPREMIWTLTLGLMAAVAVGSYLAAFCLQETFHVSDDLPLLAPNPLSVYLAEDFLYPLLFGLGWFIVVVILGYPWLRGRFLDFTPVGEEK